MYRFTMMPTEPDNVTDCCNQGRQKLRARRQTRSAQSMRKMALPATRRSLSSSMPRAMSSQIPW